MLSYLHSSGGPRLLRLRNLLLPAWVLKFYQSNQSDVRLRLFRGYRFVTPRYSIVRVRGFRFGYRTSPGPGTKLARNSGQKRHAQFVRVTFHIRGIGALVRTLQVRLAILILSTFIAAPGSASDSRSPVRIGLAAVVSPGNQAFLPDWKKYLEEKIERSVELRFLDSCKETIDLLQEGLVDFAWIGGFCYVKNTNSGDLQLMTVPVYRGEPLHRSYIIVHRDSLVTDIDDLKGGVFAFSDPDSNVGYAYPLSLLPERAGKPQPYFRHSFFTFNHAGTVQAVADQVADGGAVDSYVWEYLASVRPEMTKSTRIIGSSPNFGFSPVIYRTSVKEDTVTMVKTAFETMHREPAGKHILAELKLDEFRSYPPGLFHSTRQILNRLRIRSAWTEVVVIDQ